MPKPTPKSSMGERELDKVQETFDTFDNAVKSLAREPINTPKRREATEVEPQTKLSNREIARAEAPYIKPSKVLFPSPDPKTGLVEKFNEALNGEDREERSKYCKVIVENKELRGEMVEFWLRPWGGTPALFWQVPVNKPIFIPIYVAEHLSKRNYQRLVMQEQQIGGKPYYASEPTGQLVADEVVDRITCKQAQTPFTAFQGVA